MRKFILLLAGLPMIFAWATVQVDVMPRESRGNPITMRFLLKDEAEFEVEQMPETSAEWQVGPPDQMTTKQYFDFNGVRREVSTVTLTFLLFPLKTGSLKIPVAKIRVGNKVYTSPDVKINVTSPISNSNPAPRRKTPNFPLFPLEEEAEPPPIDLKAEDRSLEVAIMAEPSKTEVFNGELILLPFFIYTNENIFSNLEFAAFPTFKDFIKEELYLPKSWRSERVQYRGSPYYKAEIIRFALFPLKEGELLIDPLKMRFELSDDVFGIDVRKYLFGQGDKAPDDSKIMLRSSGSVPIVVKPLPPRPADVVQSEIPVGKYKINVRPPTNDLVQNEPFTLKLRVEGVGNIKGIPEPDFKTPAGIQKSKTETDYAINRTSEGYKDFDLLLVPRSSGVVTIPEQKWTYFDPDRKVYETVPMPSIELRISPSSKKNTVSAVGPETKDVVFAGKQDFKKDSGPAIPLWAWTFPALLYAAAGFFFVQRRKHESEESIIARMPWILIERKIYAQHDLSSNEALGLVEAWILKRFQVLNIDEAAFDDLTIALKKRVPSSVDAKVEKLRERFRQIESARFAGRKTNSLNLSFNDIKKLSEDIIFSSANYVQPPQFGEEEDDEEDS